MPLSDECIFQVLLGAYISPEIAYHGNVKVKVMFFCLLYLDTGYIALENEKLSRLNQELSTLSRKLEDMKQGRDSTIL